MLASTRGQRNTVEKLRRTLTSEAAPKGRRDSVMYGCQAEDRTRPPEFQHTSSLDECMNLNKQNMWLCLGESRYDFNLQQWQEILISGVINAVGRGFLVKVRDNLNFMGYRNLSADNLVPLTDKIDHDFKF